MSDEFAEIGRELLVERLQSVASQPHEAMHAAAADLNRGDELTIEHLRRCEKAAAEYQQALDLMERIVDTSPREENSAPRDSPACRAGRKDCRN